MFRNEKMWAPSSVELISTIYNIHERMNIMMEFVAFIHLPKISIPIHEIKTKSSLTQIYISSFVIKLLSVPEIPTNSCSSWEL